MRLLIDGYNLIHAGGGLFEAGANGEQREALAETLRIYRKKRPHKITVVFDGGMDPSGSRSILKGVPVVFSGSARSADDVIAEMAASGGSGLTVITDDRELGGRCRRHGAEVIGSGQFISKLMEAALDAGFAPDGEGEDTWDFTTRKKGPSRRAPKARRRKQRRFSRL